MISPQFLLNYNWNSHEDGDETYSLNNAFLNSGIINLAKQSEQEPGSVTSTSLQLTEETVENRKVLSDWTTKKTTKAKVSVKKCHLLNEIYIVV